MQQFKIWYRQNEVFMQPWIGMQYLTTTDTYNLYLDDKKNIKNYYLIDETTLNIWDNQYQEEIEWADKYLIAGMKNNSLSLIKITVYTNSEKMILPQSPKTKCWYLESIRLIKKKRKFGSHKHDIVIFCTISLFLPRKNIYN